MMAKQVEKPQKVQDAFLSYLIKHKTPLTIFLVNGIKLQGFIDGYDKFSVLLTRDRHSQIVFKHTISTIVPMTAVQLFDGERSPEQAQTLDATIGYRRSMAPRS
jgi:host factor-I protein